MVRSVARPRKITPPPEEVEMLGQEMVRWFESHPTADHFTEWYSIEKGILRCEWDLLIQAKEFLMYYEKVRNIILKRLKSGSVKEGIAHRYLSLVDTSLRDHERELVKEKAEAAKDSQDKESLKTIAEYLKDGKISQS